MNQQNSEVRQKKQICEKRWGRYICLCVCMQVHWSALYEEPLHSSADHQHNKSKANEKRQQTTEQLHFAILWLLAWTSAADGCNEITKALWLSISDLPRAYIHIICLGVWLICHRLQVASHIAWQRTRSRLLQLRLHSSLPTSRQLAIFSHFYVVCHDRVPIISDQCFFWQPNRKTNSILIFSRDSVNSNLNKQFRGQFSHMLYIWV